MGHHSIKLNHLLWILFGAFLCHLATAQTSSVKFMMKDSYAYVERSAFLLEDYGSFRVFQTTPQQLQAFNAEVREKLVVLEGADVLYLQNAPANTRQSIEVPEMFTAGEMQGSALQVIQFHGPIKNEWLAQVQATGARLIHYVDRFGYLIWTDEASRAELKGLQSHERYLQHIQPFHPYYKFRPTLLDKILFVDQPGEIVRVTVQILNHEGNQSTKETIQTKAFAFYSQWTALLRYENIIVDLAIEDTVELAHRADVVWIGERFARELHDEVQGQIMAANFDVTQSGPNSPGYLAWLDAFGFPQDPQEYPIVDVTDDGIGPGTPVTGDPTLNELGSVGGTSRIMFVSNCTSAADGGGVGGHGHINVSIAGGYDMRSGEPYQDTDGYQRGLGINPYGQFGGTRIFAPSFDLSACGGTDTGLILQNYLNGTIISTNSWGCGGCAGSYDESSQAFDVGVRDADLTAQGNQELIFVFSAGNSGPSSGTVGTPGNGKNMITVGASENDRATWTDGCNIGPSGADNAMDVIGFSSRGPSPGDRTKPELIAPGTHIQGTASTHPSYSGSSVCDQYQPVGQTVFASSSGTSHSTPAVAGLASLVYWWIENQLIVEKNKRNATLSPALMKAYLMAHAATYLTGVGANDDLPSNSQGYGMPDMTVCFDDTVRYLLDQSTLFDNTGEEWTFNGSVADPSRPVRVAMAFTDEPGAISASNPQVNDLDLEVEIDATTYLGNQFTGAWSVTGGTPDALNNYEAVFLPSGTSGALTITVRATNIAGDGVPNTGDGTDQDFAVVCYNCAQFPDFTLRVDPREMGICSDSDAVFDITIGQILGYTDPVNLDVSGIPSGASHQFSGNNITPPGAVTLTLSDLNLVTAGDYTFTVEATSTTGTKVFSVDLSVYTSTPDTPALTTPANGAIEVSRTPTLDWEAAQQAASYELDLALDAGFSQIVTNAQTSSTQFSVGSDLESLTEYFWRVRAINNCGDGNYSTTFSFTTIDQPDYMTELFDADDNDLDNTSVRFDPNGVADFYSVCGSPASVLPTDPTGGTNVSLNDDDCEGIALSTPIPFYGTDYGTIYISSNGYVTFDSCDTDYTETLGDHFSQLRVAGLFDDLNPSSGGTVSYLDLADRFVVTYQGVPQYNQSDSHTFQLEFFFNGAIQLTWLEIAAEDGLAGLSQGLDQPADFVETDLSQANACASCTGDLSGNGFVDEEDLDLMLPLWLSDAVIGDFDQSGRVDMLDIIELIQNFGECD